MSLKTLSVFLHIKQEKPQFGVYFKWFLHNVLLSMSENPLHLMIVMTNLHCFWYTEKSYVFKRIPLQNWIFYCNFGACFEEFGFVYEFCYTWKNHFLKTQVWTQTCCLRGKGTKKHYLSIIFFCTYFHLHISIIFRQELGIQPAYHQFVAPWYIWRKLITGNKTAGSQLSNFFLIKKRTLAITTQNDIGRKTLWFTSRLY